MTESIKKSVRRIYSAAAQTPRIELCCPSGYNVAELKEFIPQEVMDVSYGCGSPAGLSDVKEGETVLDIGAGGGIDCFEASKKVGEKGSVIGVDMTDEMLAIARRNAPIVARNLGYEESNVEFRKGDAEAIPVEDETVDLIISNCVINLAPDKNKVFGEMFRILKPGGRFTISDIVADAVVPRYLMYDEEKWGACLSGALPAWEYIGGLQGAGFTGIHQNKFYQWRRIDGINFLSATLTGFKQAFDGRTQTDAPPASNPARDHAPASITRRVTLRGPFAALQDEFGNQYERGKTKEVTGALARLFDLEPYRRVFDVVDDGDDDDRGTANASFKMRTRPGPCVWRGDYALLSGPFLEASDDDGNSYERGVPFEICDKTLMLLRQEPFKRFFFLVNRASESVSGAVDCCGDGCCE